MADPIIAVNAAGVKYNVHDMTDGNNPDAREHARGREAAMIHNAEEEAYRYNMENKVKAVILDGQRNPGPFLEPPKAK